MIYVTCASISIREEATHLDPLQGEPAVSGTMEL